MMAADKFKIGWIGIGIMGNPMCGHIMDAGYDLSIFARTRWKFCRMSMTSIFIDIFF